jgi:D-glycero-alpha-D-manno-heptose-7-phosphate kinase
MIISRSPFRITLAGGGTDLPSFYKNHGSRFLSCAIDKYIYVSFRERPFDKEVRVQYLDTEVVDHVSLLKHNRARACLERYGFETAVEVSSIADFSAKSGMGSSGSYIVGLLACLREHLGLNTDCMVFYTGVLRNASDILSKQQSSIKKDDSVMLEIQRIGNESIDAIKNGDLDIFGSLMHQHWEQKRKFSADMSLNFFDSLYESYVKRGVALGGKIIGAGGGGFMMLYVPKHHDIVEREMKELGFPRLNWHVSHEGVRICKW